MDTAAVTRAASAIAVAALGFGLGAARARRGGFPPWRRDRGELLEAMCLDAVFGEPGPSRVLLYTALAKAMATEENRARITSALDDIHAIIARNSPYADLGQVRHRLFALRAALSVDDDLRIRVERADIHPSPAGAAIMPDGRCADETHRRDALAETLRQRDSVVVICPRPGRDGRPDGCATLALDFHKVARVTGQAPAAGERFLLTEAAKRLHRAKYQRDAADISSIAGELASIVAGHPAYRKAEMIAVVSGRKHECSIRLGTEVAELAGKACVTLARRNESGVPEFMLTEPELVKDRAIILVDDVYRTGGTFRDAAQVLREAGARQVFGLTVTCTVSAQIPQ